MKVQSEILELYLPITLFDQAMLISNQIDTDILLEEEYENYGRIIRIVADNTVRSEIKMKK